MTDTMRAQRFYAETRTFAVEDVPVPRPGPGEVLVKVAYCGICHSDLSLIDGVFPPQLPVVTQGHEASGVIAELGPGVTGWQVGDRVIVAAGRPCGQCRNCLYMDYANCQQTALMAFAYDGAWAEYTVALAASLTMVPDNVAMDQAAILADAVSTPYGAVVHTGQIRVGESVAVWGVGGLGTHIVQLARLVGAAPIIAIDTNRAVLDRALEVGADHALDAADPGLLERITELTGGQLLDAAFDTVGVAATVRAALDSIHRGGRVIQVGLSDQDISVGNSTQFGISSKQLRGHLGYQPTDIAVLAKLVSQGRLDLSRSISAVVPLEDVARGVEMLHGHEGNPIRIVVQP